ncbi:hypothetical protein OID55_36300 [Streptomyces sp. NBC_00715]|uniref:hypothetical protein n=1 Tax=Streptomyces sp. NBC_00715 TaxID=2975811 RepID=UPI003862E016
MALTPIQTGILKPSPPTPSQPSPSTPVRSGQVTALSANWRELRIEQIGELRRYKSKTVRLERLVDFLPPGRAKDQLITWTGVRKYLP